LQITIKAAAVTVIRDTAASSVTAALTGYSSAPITLHITEASDSVVISTEWEREIGNTTKELKLEIHIPETYTGDLTVNSASGTVHIQAGSLQSLTVISASGAASVSSVSAQRIQITTVSGAVALKKAAASRITVNSTSGTVDLIDLTTEKESDISIKTASGDIRFSGRIGNLSASSASGSVDILATALSGNIMVETLSGAIGIALPKNGETFGSAASLSGQINLRIANVETEGSKQKAAWSSQNARHKIQASSISGRITITD
jgi:DUF4097 and DUF4098 domain-containing protein YvlB